MTKKTIIFDTDDESKGHYPSDEAYAPLEVGKVYSVTEDVANKNIALSPVDASSDLPTIKLGSNGLQISKTEKSGLIYPFLGAAITINGNKYETSILANGDITGDRWGRGSLYDFIYDRIGTAIAQSVITGPGWARLQSGTLLQWGSISGQNSSPSGVITFPTAFTVNYSFTAQAHARVYGTNGVTIACLADDANSLTKQEIKCFQIQTGQVIDAPAWYVKWIAIGY